MMKRTISTLAIYASLVSPVMAADLVVHEWGTFTSFMGSNGELIEGMHHEDEALPSFVHGLKKDERSVQAGLMPSPSRRCPPITKVDCDTLRTLTLEHTELFPEAPVSAGITQKMETPVIYFYGDEGTKVNIDINFPQGIITQYYPEASLAYPRLGEVKELKDSRFVFDVSLLKPTDTTLLKSTNPESIWNPARVVPKANVVKTTNGEIEKFIFYRGVGNFASPLKVTSNDQDVLTLENLSSSPITFAMVLNSTVNPEGRVDINFATVNSFSTSVRVPAPSLQGANPLNNGSHIKAVIVKALVENGLYQAEAVAMVETWEKSYFKTPGLRVLYIVPSENTEAILPLTVKPAPKELKRVLIGRVEVMTRQEEMNYLKLIQEQNGVINKEALFGRFFEPKLRRLEQLATSSELKAKIRSLL